MTPSWTSSGRFSRLLSHNELRSVFPRKRTSGSGTSSKCSSRILTSASSAMSGFCGLPVPSFFMASGARHVLDCYEPPVARALDSGEVYAHLLRPASGVVRDPRLLCSFSPGGLPYGLLSLLGCLTGGVPSLLGRLPDLIGDSAHKTSDAALLLAALLLAAAGEPAYGVLDALDGLSGLTRDLTR